MTLVVLDRVPPQRWRNGGGVTRELLAWPGVVGWVLRVSVADVACDGPFSVFDGVARWFAVLSGAGVRLDWHGRSVRLGVDSPPLAFDGGDPPQAFLIDGATRDLNLMLRRDRSSGGLRRVTPGEAWDSSAPWRGVLTLGEARLDDGGSTPRLLPPWSLEFDADAAGRRWCLHADPKNLAYWIEATPR